MRRFVVFISTLFAVTAALMSSGSVAFARVAPDDGGSPVNVAPVVHHSAGLDAWQIALIAVAGVVVLIAAALGARLMRLSHRPAPTPTTS
jgi:hypothetical protein